MAQSIEPLVGRKEMAAILGKHPNNAVRSKMPDLPESLQETYGDEMIAVAATPLWFRADIEEYARQREERNNNA